MEHKDLTDRADLTRIHQSLISGKEICRADTLITLSCLEPVIFIASPRP